MGEVPKFNRNDNKAIFELLPPGEKFAVLAEEVLAQETDPQRTGFLIEFTEVSWWGSETMNFYTLSRSEEIESGHSYFLTVSHCLDDQTLGKPEDRYYVDPETNGQIAMLDGKYDVIPSDQLDHDPNVVALAAFDEYSPELAKKYKTPTVNEQFGQIVGAYILSDRGIEDRLDRAVQLAIPHDRRDEEKGVVDEALTRFGLQMLHAIKQEAGSSGGGTAAKELFREVMYTNYISAHEDDVNRAVTRFAEGGGRVSDWTPADKLKRQVRNHMPEQVRRVQRGIGKAVAFATLFKIAQFGPGRED